MRRSLLSILVAVLAAACSGAGPDEVRGAPTVAPPTAGPTVGAPPTSSPLCSLPPEYVLRIRRGYHPLRSGEVQIVPREPAVVAPWLSHAGPWEHVQRVPLLLYGPGRVRPLGRVDRPVTVADLAPTQAALLGIELGDVDGRPLREALLPGPPPRLVVTVVWDSAGMNVLEEHPDAWPTLRGLIAKGAWFESATVGTSPSTTPAVHATLGTGVFPTRHGVVDLRFRWGSGIAWINDERAEYLSMPTVADRLAESSGRAKVALVSSPGTLSLVGHGSTAETGERPLVAMHEEGRWTIGAGYADRFRFPGYVTEVDGLDEDLRALDLRDGRPDGAWAGEPILPPEGDPAATPAWSAHQARVLEEVIEREGFGDDEVPDLLYTNFKQIDAVGHLWTMESRQMEEVVRASDEALRALIEVLDREVGEGEWVLALLADHGSIPDPTRTGAPIIDLGEMRRDLAEAFGDAVQQVRPTQVWVDEEALATRGATIDDVVTMLARYRRSDNHEVPEGEPDDLLLTAFPSSDLLSASCIPGPLRGFG